MNPLSRYGDMKALGLEGVRVVGNELEAVHQRVSPAKYFAAARKMSRSVFSLRRSASKSATRACNRTTSSAGVSGPFGALWPPPGRLPLPGTATPAARSHTPNVGPVIPRSDAIPLTVAPGVDRYNSTASRRNSSENVLRAMTRSSRFPQEQPGISVSNPRGQGPFSLE